MEGVFAQKLDDELGTAWQRATWQGQAGWGFPDLSHEEEKVREGVILCLETHGENDRRAGRHVPSENLCHPRHHKRGDRVSGGVERSETVLEGTACQ